MECLAGRVGELPRRAGTPPENDLGTSLTRERWLLPLFRELDYGRLQTAPAVEIDGRSYPISHGWEHVPIHLVSYKLELDRRTPGVAGASTASPHSLLQVFLNRSGDNLWGFLSNGCKLRILRDNASLTRQAYVEFDLEAMMEGEVYSDFVLLWLLCHQSRVEGERPSDCWLEKWMKVAEDQGTRALDQLRDGVEAAITALGLGFLEHPVNHELRDKLTNGELDGQDYYRQLLRMVYRLLFLFVAEDRDLLLNPEADDAARECYVNYYSTRRLRRMAETFKGTRHPDLFEGLRLVMRLLSGDSNGAGAGLGLVPLGSFLFSDAAVADVIDCQMSNQHLLDAVRALSLTYDQRALVYRSVDYKNLGPEELGSVYESLLELHPEINVPARRFALATAGGHERKTTGSYYTPTSLINALLDSALDPVLDEAVKPSPQTPLPEGEGLTAEERILDLKICDPACGSGHFLIAAANRMAKALAFVRTGEEEPPPAAIQQAKRHIISHCIYGVDINPIAVELCKVNLWMEALEPGKPLSFLDHRIQCGNSLLGTTPKLMAGGIPDDAFQPIEGDDRDFVASLRGQNRKERKDRESGQMSLYEALPANYRALHDATLWIGRAPDDTLAQVRIKEQLYYEMASDPEYVKARLLADAWCAAFVWEKSPHPKSLSQGERDLSQLGHSPQGERDLSQSGSSSQGERDLNQLGHSPQGERDLSQSGSSSQGERDFASASDSSEGERDLPRRGVWDAETYQNIASQAMVHIARDLRQRQTPAEVIMWEVLRNRRLGDLKFRRQHPIAQTTYVVDFLCYEARLVIELEGGIHERQQTADAQRRSEIEQQGYRVLRFTNDQVYDDLQSVLAEIVRAAHQQLPSPNPRLHLPSPSGRGAGGEGLPMTDLLYRRLEADPLAENLQAVREYVVELADRYSFFHWHVAFPDVFTVADEIQHAENEQTGWHGGFDVVLGNPPWERIKIQEKEWFAERAPEIASAPNAAARRRMIAELAERDPYLLQAFSDDKRKAEGESHFVRVSERYPLCGRGDVNTYTIFAETARHIINGYGRVGMIVPSGIATDDTTKFFFQDLMQTQSLASLYDFENREGLFPAVDSRMKFSLVTMTGWEATASKAEFVFFALNVVDLKDGWRRFTLSAQDIAALNPNTGTMATFRSVRDAEITKAIYRRVPVLIREEPLENLWGIRFATMFHMSNDSGLFRTRDELEAAGYVLRGNWFVKPSPQTPLPGGEGLYLPLYEAKMMHQFTHRWATYEPDGSTRDMMPDELRDPSALVMPRYWVDAREVAARMDFWDRGWLLGFRDITNTTNERTAIFGLLPRVAVGHVMPLIYFAELQNNITCFICNFDTFVFDYNARQKIGGTHLTYGYLKQLPVLPLHTYTPALLDFIVPRVLELSYTAWDLQPFAQDVGWDGPPFAWDEERRFLMRCELDALYFHLYQIARDDVDYIMETFPIVKRKDEAAHGEYLTKRVILEMYDQMAGLALTPVPSPKGRGENEGTYLVPDVGQWATWLSPGPADPRVAHQPRTS